MIDWYFYISYSEILEIIRKQGLENYLISVVEMSKLKIPNFKLKIPNFKLKIRMSLKTFSFKKVQNHVLLLECHHGNSFLQTN